ncbi:neuromedin-U receptor 2-like [Acropora palmata]|uniref:neuromedin-U receptor 2-like n=1 Tax=Acropora palmata TaxID=6131 RepID=UPI003DA1A390
MTSFLSLFISIASIPFLLTGVIGNVLVIRIVHKTPDMHSVTNYLLVNLAVSDLMTILMIWPWMVCTTNGFVKDIGNYCWMSVFGYIKIVVSSVTLTVLAVERYHALLKPLRSRLRLTKDKVKKTIAAIWIFGGLTSLPSVFLNYKESKNFCTVWNQAFFFPFSAIVIYIPSVVFVFCYGNLIKGLYFDKTICSMDAEIQRDRATEKKKLVVTFLLVTVNFLAGYGPMVVFQSLSLTGAIRQNIVNNVEAILLFLFFCSSCLNPVLYAFRSTNFQQGFKRIIFCRKPQSQTDV